MIVLDTNVISEVLRPIAEPAVLDWLRSTRRSELWTSSIVVAELLSGVDLLSAGKRQQTLREKMEQMVSTIFTGRILTFNLAAARAYGPILAARQMMGRPIDEMDALIAATALANGATLATRNIPDFEHCGISLVNPWDAAV
jgi:predicted nucleic acid-binding protein